MRPIATALLLCLGACGGTARTPAASPVARAPAAAAERADPLSAAALLRSVSWLAGDAFAGRGSYQGGGRAAADALAARLVALGYELHRQPVPGGADNVIAIRRGGARALIIAAHYDHLGIDAQGRRYPGADDNASGVAVLLGLAKSFADEPLSAASPTLLFIAFGAEEEGLVGSRAYVAEPLWPLADTLAVINFDMVGRRLLQDAIDRPAAVAVVGIDALPGARATLAAAGQDVGLAIVPMPPEAIMLVGAAHRTDEWSFRQVGVPAIHFSTGLHADYHQRSDTADRIDAEQLHRIATVARALVSAVLGTGGAARSQGPASAR